MRAYGRYSRHELDSMDRMYTLADEARRKACPTAATLSAALSKAAMLHLGTEASSLANTAWRLCEERINTGRDFTAADMAEMADLAQVAAYATDPAA